MIRRIEALNYRCLRYVSQDLDDFHVLVGPNASGKTTFLDVLAFLAQLVSEGLDAAVAERTPNFHDLVWRRGGDRFELAVEVVVPENHLPPMDLVLSGEGYAIRYEVAIGLEGEGQGLRILDEQILLTEAYRTGGRRILKTLPETLISSGSVGEWRALMRWNPEREEYLVSPEIPDEETTRSGDSAYQIVYRPTGQKPVLAHLSEHEFPTAVWLEETLRSHIRFVSYDSAILRKPSRPGQGVLFLHGNGANLPWVISEMEQKTPERYRDWLGHVRLALPDLEAVRVIERPEDRHRYLMLCYRGGLEVPSWMVSDGTLRLVAITVLAYAPQAFPIYLIEEPENSIHPLNLEIAMQSLGSVYDGQVLVATHSPAVLALIEASKVLAFTRDESTGTSIIRGSEHPRLREWKGEVSLGTLFAGGVFG